jgi:mono/diheme cytochrome c family protein
MKYLYGALVLLFLQFIAAGALLYSGAINVAASEPHSALAEWIFETGREHSVRRHARVVLPPVDEHASQVEVGFSAFRDMCASCHGAPGKDPDEIGKGLTPRAPNLAHVAEERSPGELFWVIKHGIKMTGMPAWGITHSDDELWAIVAFLEQLPTISPEEYRNVDARAGAHSH